MRSIRTLDADRRYVESVVDLAYIALVILLAVLSLAMIRYFDRL